MGVSTIIYLPPNVRIKDVCTAMGILSGGKIIKHKCINNSKPFFYVETDNIKVEKSTSKYNDYFNINITIKDENVLKMNECSGQGNRASAFWFFENERLPGWRYISFGCREYSEKLGKALVEFFGGKVDCDDCDDIKYDIEINPKPDSFNNHSENEDYDKFQIAISNLKPLK